VQPAAGKAIHQPQHHATDQCEHHHDRHKSIELSRHDRESVNLLAGRLALDKMNENSGQVKNSRHPGHDKQNMKGLYPKHSISSIRDN